MLVKTILNKVYPIKGFVYGKVEGSQWEGKASLEVEVRPREGSRGICSGCGKKRPGYDTLGLRRFEFVPLWGIKVFLMYIMRRVECSHCGVKVEQVPWADGKYEQTKAYQWFLAGWAKRMSWSQVAEAFQTNGYRVYHAVERAVEWGRAHMDLQGITAIGVDELYIGHNEYVTLVYQIDQGCKRLLWMGKRRCAKTLLQFFHWLGEERSRQLEFICSDMWKPYLKVVAKKASQALNILDRFHIMAHMNKAINEVRAQEAKELKAKKKEPVLKGSRWWFLKRPQNLTEKPVEKLSEVLKHNLKTVRSYLLKEEFQFFWEYRSAGWAVKFLDQWCTKVMRSRIEPMKRVARMLRNHRPLILNWFRAKKEFSSGIVEGLNNKARVTTKMAYGFRTYKALEVALYHRLGNLPEPKFTHRFS